MKTKAVPFSWIERWGKRLDCGPYMGGAVEARFVLEEARTEKEPLCSLTAGHNGGIYNGPMFRRNYVESPEHGVPFLTSGSMLRADLSDLPLLRKKDAESAKLSYLRLMPGTTMISCSGTIGRMVYARSDMAGMWASQDILKVVPNPDRIPSGYLYAFLSSKFGLPLVTSGTYGAIIQHIEPEHIADLPVPRLGEAVEKKAHELVERAAELRAGASAKISEAVRELESLAGLDQLPIPPSPTPFCAGAIPAFSIEARFDAFFHSDYHRKATEGIRDCQCGYATIGEISASVVEPARFKRVQIDDVQFGIPFFGTATLFWSEPSPAYLIPKRQSGLDQYIVQRNSLLIPRSGQISGIIGTVVMPHGAIIGGAVTEDAIRINCNEDRTAGYLFIALSSAYGIRQLKARAYGSSIPHLDVHHVRAVLVPDPGSSIRAQLGSMSIEASLMRDKAIHLEREARAAVEHAIEEAA